MVEVQMCVDDDIDAGEVEVLLAQRMEARIHVSHRGVKLRQARVDQHARIGMVDDVHVDRHPLALGEQVSDEDWSDGNRGEVVHRVAGAGTRPRLNRQSGCIDYSILCQFGPAKFSP